MKLHYPLCFLLLFCIGCANNDWHRDYVSKKYVVYKEKEDNSKKEFTIINVDSKYYILISDPYYGENKEIEIGKSLYDKINVGDFYIPLERAEKEPSVDSN